MHFSAWREQGGGHILRWIAQLLFELGGFGLLLLGFFDSSLLTAPLGNDLLLVALTAHNKRRAWYYAAMATGGSMLGCLFVDALSRRAENSLREKVPRERLRFVQRRMERNAGWALAVAALMPPPFPFTAFVAGAAGSGYPRRKLLAIAGAARFIRFGAEAALAIRYGPNIAAMAGSPTARYTVLTIIVLSLGATGYSIYRWVRHSQEPSQRSAPRHAT
jgi:membrane protein YqaA with SNARE-associated domain